MKDLDHKIDRVRDHAIERRSIKDSENL